MAKLSIRVRGLKKMLREIEGFRRKGINNAMASAVHASNNVIMTNSKRRVPVDSEDLRKSGYVAEPIQIGNRIVGEIGYGGKAEAYAVIQHEDLTLNHPRGGEAKFLENARNATVKSAFRASAKAARESFRTGKRIINKIHPSNPNEGG